jgi:Tfp pilus assembly protein PilO
MKNKHILLSVLLVAVIAFGFYPLLQTVKQKETQNEQLFAQKQQQIERLTELENTEKITGSKIALPTSPEQVELINDISRIAKITGLDIPSTWSFSVGHNSDVNAEQISVSFSLSGRHEQIQKFLTEVEQNPRFMGVKDFSFTTDFTKSIPTTEMPITLYAFFLEA